MPVFAQNAAQTGPVTAQTGGWKRIGGTAFGGDLAGAATGPVVRAWYAGSSLLVQTASGRVFETAGETADIVRWNLNTSDSASPSAGAGGAAGVGAFATRGLHQYVARADNVYGSADDGNSWINLTGFNGRSILGDGFSTVAIAPANPMELAVTNRFGVWRSLDGGITWRGLNDDLPNLGVRRLLGRREVELENGLVLNLTGGQWSLTNDADTEPALRAAFTAKAHVEITAAAQRASTAYAGTADGRLLASRDGGATWSAGALPAAVRRIERIWVDSDRPDVALAAAGSTLLRTVNGGLFWDDVTAGLPEGQIHGIAADRSAGVVYAATDRGVFSGRISLNDAGPVAPGWQSVSRDLPAAPAWDAMLNPDNTLTVALDGYGVFEAPAPHQTRRVRIVNGADLSERAAAPGSLVSVLGAEVRSVTSGSAAYPVIASSGGNSQLQIPFEAAPGTLSLAFETASDRWTVPLVVKDAAPAIFVDADGAPLVLDAASGLVVDPKTAIYAGSTVQLMATGLGRVTPDWPTGIPAPLENPPTAATPVSAFLDGKPLEVTRATLAPGYVGYYIVELRIPSIVNRGAGELRIVMNGEESNRVKLYLEPDLPKY